MANSLQPTSPSPGYQPTSTTNPVLPFTSTPVFSQAAALQNNSSSNQHQDNFEDYLNGHDEILSLQEHSRGTNVDAAAEILAASVYKPIVTDPTVGG